MRAGIDLARGSGHGKIYILPFVVYQLAQKIATDSP